MHFSVEHLPLADVRHLKLESTQRLLGDTIQITDEDWESASRLPGWTRAHVAAHIARNADAYRRVVEGVLTGDMVQMYPSPEASQWDIERSSEQTPLELQIDLDTSASRLFDAFEQVTESQWGHPVRFGGSVYPLKLIVLSRLSEVVLHHIDLDCGFEVEDIDEETATWILRWCVQRLREIPTETSYSISLPDGTVTTIGPSQANTPIISGTTAGLVGWLSGRAPDADVTAPQGFHPPRVI